MSADKEEVCMATYLLKKWPFPLPGKGEVSPLAPQTNVSSMKCSGSLFIRLVMLHCFSCLGFVTQPARLL